MIDSTTDSIRHANGYYMWMGMGLAFAFWLIFVIPNVTSALLSIVFLLGIMGVGLILIKQRWIRLHHKYDRYTRTFVLSHFSYIFLMSLLITIFLCCWIEGGAASFGYEENVKYCIETKNFLSDVIFTRYFIIIFFTLNGFVLPFIVGWLPLKIDRFRATRKLRKIQRQYIKQIKKAQEERWKIQRGL